MKQVLHEQLPGRANFVDTILLLVTLQTRSPRDHKNAAAQQMGKQEEGQYAPTGSCRFKFENLKKMIFPHFLRNR
jgi:hypothetical protein